MSEVKFHIRDRGATPVRQHYRMGLDERSTAMNLRAQLWKLPPDERAFAYRTLAANSTNPIEIANYRTAEMGAMATLQRDMRAEERPAFVRIPRDFGGERQ